MTLD
jgi:hypothetical protein